ncbi:MANSC domain-containing protein 4-like [Scleropages formosus]|uniref:MANSC domain-containing protein 4-like n=1 Tax=Scleropages formosus TaxID=113540 RepID=A0A0P7WRG8_SCLFO|nr:MANSC domain-containing protein 4-like [Scleropages formosus]
MTATWRLLLVLSVACGAEATCSPTTFYRNCWIRRFPGLLIDVDASARRGAQLLRTYQEDSAVKCSRTCCLSRNFSCNLAVFHYDTAQESVNCFHLHCPTLESCILKHRGNVILYNITAGADPDLLVFGKYFSTVRAWPQLSSRLNSSEVHVSDKRHFNRLPMPPVLPRTPSSSPKPGKNLVSSTSDTHPPLSRSGSSTQSTPKSQSDAVIPIITKPLPTISGSTHIPSAVSHTTLRFIYRTTTTSPTRVTSTIITPTTSLEATSPTYPVPPSSTTAASATFTTSTTSTTAASSAFINPTSLRESTSSAYPFHITSTTPASSAYITHTAFLKAAISAQTLTPRPIIASSGSQVGTHTEDAISSTDTSISSPITARFSSTTITVPPVVTSSASITSSTPFTRDRSISTTSTTSLGRSTSRPANQLTTRSQSSNTPGYHAPSLHLITATPVSTRPHSFPIGPANIDSGKQHPNDTKGYANRNHTAGDSEGNGVKPAPETPNWYGAAKALLVPVVVSAAILLGCCCSVLLAFSWRDKRKGLYRTSWGKKRGSMRLVKYVIVKENF